MPFLVCRHIKTNGVQCQSPAMRGEPFCYYHDKFRRKIRPAAGHGWDEVMTPTVDRKGNFSVEAQRGGVTSAPIDLGLLEDAESVQVAISAVVNALAGNRMQMKQATALLYGLQLAAMNCRNLPASPPYSDRLLREVIELDGENVANYGLKDNEQWSYNHLDGEPEDDADEDDAEPDADEADQDEEEGVPYFGFLSDNVDRSL